MTGTWFSRLESAIESAPQPRATAAQWRGMIRKAEGGVGKTEMEWTGIERALEDAGDTVLTKEEVLGMARERPVGLSEEVFKAEADPAEMARLDAQWAERHTRVGESAAALGDDVGMAEKGNGTTIYDRTREANGDYLTIGHIGNDEYLTIRPEATPEQSAAMERYAMDSAALSTTVRERDKVQYGTQAKFSKWTQGEWGLNPEANSREIRVTLDGSDYVPNSSHNTPPGELVRIRTTDRQVGGDNTLFLEEIQSDWHQAGRKEGYAGGQPSDADIGTLGQIDLQPDVSPGGDMRGIVDLESGEIYTTPEEVYDSVLDMMGDESIATEAASAARRVLATPLGVPDAPFQKTDEWVGLALRRSLQEAAQGGYERMAWVSGEQAADLYDLRKQVSRIEYDEAGGNLVAYGVDGNRRVINETGVTPDQLEDYIGKDPARALMEQQSGGFVVESDVRGVRDHYPDRASAEAEYNKLEGFPRQNTRIREADSGRMIEGDDLSVGGEGMDTFYNRVVPKALQKEIKRFGLEIEPVSIAPKLDEGRLPDGYELVEDEALDRYGEPVTNFVVQRYTTPGNADNLGDGATAAEALRNAVAGSPELRALTDAEPTNLSIRLTPESRERILKEGLKIAGGAGLLGAQLRQGQEQENKPRLGQRLQDAQAKR